MTLSYQEPQPISRDDLNAALASNDGRSISIALIRMALHEPDWEWAERICLTNLEDKRTEVKNAALTGLSHLARIHRKLHLEIVLPKIKCLLSDADSHGIAEDTLGDIGQYVSSPEI